MTSDTKKITKKYFAGIGSRKTPRSVCIAMTKLTSLLTRDGWVLRSGGADGVDIACENGVVSPELKEIYLPWKGFNGNKSPLYPASDDAFLLAAQHHPYWKKLKPGPKKLHARNSHQILGKDLQTPSSFVICWTIDGTATGGTGQAIRIADAKDIPVFNLFNEADRIALTQFLKEAT